MSGPEDAHLRRSRLPGDGGALTPTPAPVTGAAPSSFVTGLAELPGDSDRTIELPLGLTMDLAGDRSDAAGGSRRSSADAHLDGGGAGAQLPPSELYGETPTAPLPVDIEVDLDGTPAPQVEPAGESDGFASPGEGGASFSSTPELAATERPGTVADDVPEELEDSLDEALDDDIELVEAAGAGPTASASVSAERLAMTPPPVPVEASGPIRVAAPAPAPAPVTAVPTQVPPLPPQELLQPTEAWAEPLSQRPRRKRLKPWFEEVFDEDYLRTLPFMTAEQTLREVSFIRDGLNPPADGELLDVACGYGRHAIELSQRGLKVTGIDLSLPLLIRAADESQRRGLSVNFVHADMRELTFENQFDGAYCMLSSFGYFDEETNLKVAAGICRALKPGGRLLLDTINRDYIVGELPTRVWWEGDGCLVLEEVDFNYHTSRLAIRRSVVFQDGRQLEHDISIRAYSLHELGKLMRQAGFRVVDVSGSIATRGHFFGATSRNLIVVCEKAV